MKLQTGQAYVAKLYTERQPTLTHKVPAVTCHFLYYLAMSSPLPKMLILTMLSSS